MDADLYKAAESGWWDVIQQYEQQLDTQRTRSKDTVLHVLSRSCDSSFVAQQILTVNPKFILKLNADKETPLHIAARNGHAGIVRAVLDCIKQHEKCKSVLRSRNEYGNIALHEAIKNNHLEIIQLLVEEDHTLVNVRNGLKRSPLFLAAENGDERVLALILSHKPVNDVPRLTIYRSLVPTSSYYNTEFVLPDNRNALHAAAIRNFPECVKLLLHELPHLTGEVDRVGWNALHYAARFNHPEVASELLISHHCSGINKALHIAVTWGNTQVIEELLTYCPDCWSVLVQRKNVIHLAVEKEQQEVLNFILRKSWASELLNGMDFNGNTPLHYYVATKKLLGYELVNHPLVERNALNKAGLTPMDMIRCAAHEDKEREDFLRSELGKAGGMENRFCNFVEEAQDTKSMKKFNTMAETYQVITTLIIAITFAAGFTIPGGYENNDNRTKGHPILLKQAAFMAFIVFDFGALLLSWRALLRLLLHHHIKTLTVQKINLLECRFSLILSLAALLLSFVTGLYVTIPNLGIRLSLFIFVFGGSITFFGFLVAYLSPYSPLKYSVKDFIYLD